MPDTSWTPSDLDKLDSAQEIRVRTRRRDGSLRSARTIWVVVAHGRVVVRSAHGRDAAWFRWALATGRGALVVGGVEHPVRFVEVDDEALLSAADAAYRVKYGRYASIVDDLVRPGPRAATLTVVPQ